MKIVHFVPKLWILLLCLSAARSPRVLAKRECNEVQGCLAPQPTCGREWGQRYAHQPRYGAPSWQVQGYYGCMGGEPSLAFGSVAQGYSYSMGYRCLARY